MEAAVDEAVAALKLERDRARAYLELNEAILLDLDSGLRVREINVHGANLLGAPAEAIRGREWLDFFDGPGEREQARSMLTSALASAASREREFAALDATGAARRIYWRCIALRSADGTAAGWLCSGTDVTDRALREQHAHLAQERLTRVARLATMGEMASGIAHEINQPLTAITTYARACEHYLGMANPDFVELREVLREIGAEGMRAGDIVTKLRRMVRNDAPEEHQSLDVNALIEELRSLLQADARVHGVELRFALTPGLPRIEAHGVQLQQVILNLARNAFEALAEMAPRSRAREHCDRTVERRRDRDPRERRRARDLATDCRPAVLSFRHHQGQRHRARPRHQPYHRAVARRYHRCTRDRTARLPSMCDWPNTEVCLT